MLKNSLSFEKVCGIVLRNIKPYDMSIDDLKIKNEREFVYRRQEFYWIMCNLPFKEFTLNTIGDAFNQDHSTVLYGKKIINDQISLDTVPAKLYKKRMDSLLKKCVQEILEKRKPIYSKVIFRSKERIRATKIYPSLGCS